MRHVHVGLAKNTSIVMDKKITAALFFALAASFTHTAGHANEQDAGKALYLKLCAGCHGLSGKGDGMAGKTLNPPPADLVSLMAKKETSVPYLNWVLRDGGKELHTDMPAFSDVEGFTQEQAEDIISFLKNRLAQ
jgi:mono/diheme cytochrome c family protein